MYLNDTFSDEPTGDARKALLNELRNNNPAVERELQDFKDLVGQELRIRIISVYERKPGHRLIPTPKTPNDPSKENAEASVIWRRAGNMYNPLPKKDSVLGFPSWLELQLPSDSDHSILTKFDHKDTIYQLIDQELQRLTAKPMVWKLSFESDTTEDTAETPIARLSPLRTSLKSVVEKLRTRYQTLSKLEPLGVELLRALAESQVLLELAEDVSCRAIILRNEVELGHIAMAIQHESGPLESELQAMETHLRPSTVRNHSEAPFQTLLQTSLRFNTRLKALLTEETPTNSTPNSEFRRDLKAINELMSLRCSGDISTTSTTPELPEPEWILSEHLYFPAEPELEKDHEKESWLDKVLHFFTESESSDLKLKPRRFAALRTDTGFEKVMVEFCPCAEQMASEEPSTRRQRLIDTARTILQSNHSTSTGLSTVPLRGISFMETPATQAFLIIFKADALLSLDEAFDKFDTPSVKSRVWLALCYARSIAVWHSACFCHGLINPFNLHLQMRDSRDEQSRALQVESTVPMIAGFDIARHIDGSTDLIDVEDPHWRVHLHPDRIHHGYDKERQDPRHDVFSLGMVLIEVGLWMVFSRLRKYRVLDEEVRREYCVKLRKQFKGDGDDGIMPGAYRDVVEYCLGRSRGLPGVVVNERQRRLLGGLDGARAGWVVDALVELYGSLS